jgi:hypothetical protein
MAVRLQYRTAADPHPDPTVPAVPAVGTRPLWRLRALSAVEMTMAREQKIKTKVWRAAANWFGAVDGKLIGPTKTKGAIDAMVDSEVMRIKRSRFDATIYRNENNDQS